MSTPPAGWYLSKDDPSIEQWWDGSQWTDHTRKLVEASGSVSESTLLAGTNVAAGQRANGWAVAAFWCGVGSLLVNPFFLPSIAAVIFGALGIHRSGITGIGRRPSIAGLVLGIVGLVVGGWLFNSGWTWLYLLS